MDTGVKNRATVRGRGVERRVERGVHRAVPHDCARSEVKGAHQRIGGNVRKSHDGAIHASESEAAASGEQAGTESKLYRAIQGVGASRRERRQLREGVGEWPAVVGRGWSACRPPPGRVSLSAPREETPVRHEVGGRRNGENDSADAGDKGRRCADDSHVRVDGTSRTGVEQRALHAEKERRSDERDVEHQ
eukprot:5364588-Pleurochrysis_carterae.AAC.2